MEDIQSLLRKRLNQHKLNASSGAAMVIFRAEELLKKSLPESKTNAKISSLKEGVLWIEVESAVWAQEIWGVADSLLGELQKEYGSKLVQKIRTKSLTSL